MASWDSIKGEYEAAFGAAKQANLQRYNETLAGYGERESAYKNNAHLINVGYNDLLKRQERIGDSDRLALQDAHTRNLGMAQMQMYNRGLGSSTLMANAERAANRDLSRSQIDLSDTLARQYAAVAGQKLGYMDTASRFRAGLEGDRLGMMERRTDSYPDLRNYLAMAQMDGAGFGGMPPMPGGGGASGFGGSPRAAGGGGGVPYGTVIRGNGDGTYSSAGPGGSQTLNFNPVGGGYGNNPFSGNALGAATNPFSGQSGSYGGGPAMEPGMGMNPFPGWENNLGPAGGDWQNADPWGMPDLYGAATGWGGYAPVNNFGFGGPGIDVGGGDW